VILELQDELRCLEDNLSNLDTMDVENGDGKRLKSRAYDLRQAKREKTDSTRAQLITAIRDKLVSYGTLMNAHCIQI
jgi:aspartyl-tRNA synthetase